MNKNGIGQSYDIAVRLFVTVYRLKLGGVNMKKVVSLARKFGLRNEKL